MVCFWKRKGLRDTIEKKGELSRTFKEQGVFFLSRGLFFMEKSFLVYWKFLDLQLNKSQIESYNWRREFKAYTMST